MMRRDRTKENAIPKRKVVSFVEMKSTDISGYESINEKDVSVSLMWSYSMFLLEKLLFNPILFQKLQVDYNQKERIFPKS